MYIAIKKRLSLCVLGRPPSPDAPPPSSTPLCVHPCAPPLSLLPRGLPRGLPGGVVSVAALAAVSSTNAEPEAEGFLQVLLAGVLSSRWSIT